MVVTVQVFFLILSSVVAVASGCGIMAIQECNKHELVSEFKLHAFLPKDKFEETCRNMRIVFDCIYQPKYMDGCIISQTFYYDAQRDVSNAVCTDGEYLKHADCLGNKDLADKVRSDCMRVFQGEGCDPLIHARTCMTSIVLGKCGQKDSDYMDVLVYYFLGSLNEMRSCPALELPEMLKKKEETTKPMPTGGSMTTMMTKQTGTMGPASSTTTKGSGASRTAPSATAAAAVALVILLFVSFRG